MQPDLARLRALIRDVPDFPSPGILFRDLTPLLGDAWGLREAVSALAGPFHGAAVDRVAGIESRGFVLGAPVALELGVGFVPVRKRGKLPHDTFEVQYDLEYGSDAVEIHVDAVRPGERVLLVDDLVATGGTAGAAVELLRKAGAEVVGCAFLIELGSLGGRERLAVDPVHVVLEY